MSLELGIWLSVVIGILGAGMGAMVRAYRRPLGNAVLFPNPVALSTQATNHTARTQFEVGYRAFTLNQFPRAFEAFTAVLEADPTCAEAAHNAGLAQANLGNDSLAARALLRASDYYDRQTNRAGFELVKQQLDLLAERRRGIRGDAPIAVVGENNQDG